ncbi:MAG: S-layer homology domain-containing protein [Ruminococcaceae bacterium]|nr:S-layer homology domain-containing protein [Oscillospiraceae bacterium]
MKKIVSLLLVLLMLSGTVFAAGFTDLDETHWAYPHVSELVEKGVINGYEDGTFRPDANVTRAELAKLLYMQFGENGWTLYMDVEMTDWFYPYVTQTHNYFIVPMLSFYPDRAATREEVAYAIYVAKNLAPVTTINFTDAADIDTQYQQAVAAVAAEGIINGYPDGTFLPKNNITRAEVATVLHRAIDLNGTPEGEEDIPTGSAGSLEEVREGIVGTWVVVKNDIYDGPLKWLAQQWVDEYFYEGSEHIFTEDGIFQCAEGKYVTTYEILSDTKISCVTVIGGDGEQIYDYELNGDEFVLYGNYYMDDVVIGHSNATYFKRK